MEPYLRIRENFSYEHFKRKEKPAEKRQTMKEDAFCLMNPKSLPVMLYLTYPQPVFLASFQIYVKLTILHGLL